MPRAGEYAHVHDEMVGAPWARFDDLREGTARLFQASDKVLVATRHDQVAGVLAAVEDATRAGKFAFGYLAYEAAQAWTPPWSCTRAPPTAPRWPGSR